MSESIITAVTNQLNGLIDPFTQDKMTAGKALKSVKVSDTTLSIVMHKGYPINDVLSELSQLVSFSG